MNGIILGQEREINGYTLGIPRGSSNVAGKLQNWSLIGGTIIDENVGFSSKPL